MGHAPSQSPLVGSALAKERLSGLVLCGGRSRRMGCDKARLGLGDSTLLERAVATLGQLTDDVRLACGTERRYAELGRPLIVDRFAEAGPLAGLEAGLSALPEGLVLVLACDMPHSDASALSALVEIAQRERLDVVLPRSAQGLEPLCAVWSTRMAEAARAALAAGERKVTAAFDHPLRDGSLPRVRAVDEEELPSAGSSAWRNVNTPEDLERERALAGERRGRTMETP